jgi:hypothetical protein
MLKFLLLFRAVLGLVQDCCREDEPGNNSLGLVRLLGWEQFLRVSRIVRAARELRIIKDIGIIAVTRIIRVIRKPSRA